MYLKQLTIFETFPIEKDIRNIHFKNHLNLVVDESKKNEKANGIGKTTVLRIIDICLGSKSKTSLYIDKENGITNMALKEYIEAHKLSTYLTITDNFDNPKLQWKLKVDLFPNGRNYINGERYNQDSYRTKLNEIFFNNTLDSPSFRQLIKMFVRIDSDGDNSKFLRFLDAHTTNIQYENIYNYLFDFQKQYLSESIKLTKESLKTNNDDIISHKKITKFDYIDSVRQRLNVLDAEAGKVLNGINLLIDSDKYKENEAQIQQVKVEYAELMDQISKYQFKITRVKKILSEAKKEQSMEIDRVALSELYGEAKEMFGKLNKTFSELIKFNSELINNKIDYFKKQLSRFETALIRLETKQKVMFDSYSGVIMLIESNKIEEYEVLQKKLEELNEKRGKNKQIIEVYEELVAEKDRLEIELKRLEKEKETNPDILSKFNQYFSEYSKLTNNEECFLFRTEDGFPLSIDNVSRNFSTGTKKSVIAAFDLAYQTLAHDIGKKVPNFFVHDVIESVDRFAMEAIVNTINSLNSQYIIAVLKDKIDGIQNINESDIIIKLSESNRLFKI